MAVRCVNQVSSVCRARRVVRAIVPTAPGCAAAIPRRARVCVIRAVQTAISTRQPSVPRVKRAISVQSATNRVSVRAPNTARCRATTASAATASARVVVVGAVCTATTVCNRRAHLNRLSLVCVRRRAPVQANAPQVNTSLFLLLVILNIYMVLCVCVGGHVIIPRGCSRMCGSLCCGSPIPERCVCNKGCRAPAPAPRPIPPPLPTCVVVPTPPPPPPTPAQTPFSFSPYTFTPFTFETFTQPDLPAVFVCGGKPIAANDPQAFQLLTAILKCLSPQCQMDTMTDNPAEEACPCFNELETCLRV